MKALTNHPLEQFLTDAQKQFPRLSEQDRGELSWVPPEDPEPEFDVTKLFPPLDEAVLGPSLGGRPDDYPGFESLSVLITVGGCYKAGKSYRPDPSGLRRAVKVDDYTSGVAFLCQVWWIDGLDDVFALLQRISKDPCKFVIRGHLPDEVHERRQNRITKEVGYFVKRRAVRIHGLEGCFTDVSRQLQMLDFDGVPLPENMSIVDDPEACVKWAVDRPCCTDRSFGGEEWTV
jgi:hypothetical protein